MEEQEEQEQEETIQIILPIARISRWDDILFF
jgi:hypothetical protein